MSTLDMHQLKSLLDSLNRLIGVKFALMDERTHEVYTSSFRTPFCQLIQQEQEGLSRCVACDQAHAQKAAEDVPFECYICHAGLVEVTVPVFDQGKRVATILFGQVLQTGDREKQWQVVRRCCQWYPAPEELHMAFLQLKHLDRDTLQACADIVHACVSEVRLTGLMALSARTDQQRLMDYLDTHYGQPLTIGDTASALGMGKTKLCRVVREASGKTFSALLQEKRMHAAARLLGETRLPVREVADAVGIADYNYFTKVFRRQYGTTPSAWRQQKLSCPATPDEDAP